MDNLTEQAAYIKGLAHGLKLDEDDEFNKLLMHIIRLLEKTTAAIEDISFREKIILDVLDEIDNDLLLVETHLFNKNYDLFSGFDDLNFDSYEQDAPNELKKDCTTEKENIDE